jgi:hypothetical protein
LERPNDPPTARCEGARSWPEKLIRIWSRTGRRLLLAAGNSYGDIPMLHFTQHRDKPFDRRHCSRWWRSDGPQAGWLADPTQSLVDFPGAYDWQRQRADLYFRYHGQRDPQDLLDELAARAAGLLVGMATAETATLPRSSGVVIAVGAPFHLIGFALAQFISPSLWLIAVLGSVALGAGLALAGYRTWQRPAS